MAQSFNEGNLFDKILKGSQIKFYRNSHTNSINTYFYDSVYSVLILYVKVLELAKKKILLRCICLIIYTDSNLGKQVYLEHLECQPLAENVTETSADFYRW